MSITRRDFVRNTSITLAGLSMNSKSIFGSKTDQRVKLAFIGVGLRGQNHLENALRRNDIEVVAICDVDDRMLDSAKELFRKSNKPLPKIFTGDNYVYRKMLETQKVDGVLIVTPWEWHTPMILDALSAGIKY